VGADIFKQTDIIITEPLHKKRLLKRRYNQSVLLSAILARELMIEHVPDLLIRTKNTPPQQDNIKKRSQNVRGAFKVGPDQRHALKNKNIMLIDDVYTTGATAENCAKALKKPVQGKSMS
jgi:predicted amidophosphoribosyltransferase